MADDISTYISLLAAAAGLGSSIAGAAGGGGQKTLQTSTSQVEFPQETLGLIRDTEFPLLAGSLGSQAQMVAPFLGGFGRNTPWLTQQYGSAPQTVGAAVRKGGAQAGISDLGPAFENFGGMNPQLFGALQNLVLQRGAQVNAAVPPGYGAFFAPSSFSQQSAAPPSPFATGFQLAQSFGSLAGALYQ